MADNKDKKVLTSSIEREQSQTRLNSAESGKIKGSTNLNVPHLRFPEFSGEWVEITLGRISEITKGSGISKDQLSEQGSPCILYGELYTKYKSEIIDEVYSRTELEPSSLVKSMANDVIIPCSGETAIDISTARCVPFDNILLGGDLNIIRLKHDDGGFFAYQLNGARKKDIARVAQGVSVVHLYSENLKHIRVYHPVVEEQKKITRLLSLIDERIATQNKIIEDLKLLRDAISKQLFYTRNNWSTFKVSDIAEIGRGRVISAKEIAMQSNPLYPVYSSQTSNNGVMGFLDDYAFDGEYITWTTDGANAGTVFYRNGKFNCTNVCGILKLRSEYDTYFCSLVLGLATRKYVSINLANPKLMNNTMASITIGIPSLTEQKRISNLFRGLDNELNRNETLVRLYNLVKTFLLQQLFI